MVIEIFERNIIISLVIRMIPETWDGALVG